MPIWKISSPRIGGTAFFVPLDSSGADSSIPFDNRSNLVITNFHVVWDMLGPENNTLKEVRLTQGDRTFPVKVKKLIRVSIPHDLALLSVDHYVEDPLHLKEVSPSSEEELFIRAYPEGLSRSFRKIGKIDYSNPYVYQFPINSWGGGGSSGAPILDSENNVAGVVSQLGLNLIKGITTISLRDFIEEKKGLECSSFPSAKECMYQEVRNSEKLLMTSQDINIQYEILALLVHLTGEYSRDMHSILEDIAQRGHPLAQCELGRLYADGYHNEKEVIVEKDLALALALHWFKSSNSLITSNFYQRWFSSATTNGGYDLFITSANNGMLLSQIQLVKKYNFEKDLDQIRFLCRRLKNYEVILPHYNREPQSKFLTEKWNEIIPICQKAGYEI